MNRIELTCTDTVAASQASVTTACFTCACGVHGGTCPESVVHGDARTILTGAVASHNCHHGFAVGDGHVEEVGHPRHHFTSTNRAKQPVDRATIRTFHKGFGKAGASGVTAPATISSRERFLNLSYARIFYDSKL